MKHAIQQLWSHSWGLSITAGVLLGLSFPPFPFPFLSFIGFLLVFRIIDLAGSVRQAALHTWVAFVIWNLIVTYWLMMATLAAGVAAILANAAVMTVPVMLQKKTAQWFRAPVAVALLQACWWVGFEYLHHQWELAWPWLSVGNAWADVPQLVQYVSATGYLGVSFWVVGAAALGCRLAVRRTPALQWNLAALLLLLPVISLVQWTVRSPEPAGTINAVIAQPNFDSYSAWGGYSSPMQAMRHLVRQTDSLADSTTDLVLWPENGIHPSVSAAEASVSEAQVESLLRERAVKWNATVIGGSTFWEYYREEEVPALARVSGDNRFLPFNSAVAFYPDTTLQVYRKHKLVPIVERVPYVRFLDAADLFDWVDWAEIQGYGRGREATLFRTGEGLVPALICYDSVFPGWVRQFVKNGAGIITVITNDGWWGDTGGHEQHFSFARLRAIAFQRYVVRSANNGISGVIAPDGTVKKRTEYWTVDAFRYDIPVIEQQTIYARYGDWLPVGCLLLCGISLGLAGFSRSGSKRSH